MPARLCVCVERESARESARERERERERELHLHFSFTRKKVRGHMGGESNTPEKNLQTGRLIGFPSPSERVISINV